jgi:hypothetical protein
MKNTFSFTLLDSSSKKRTIDFLVILLFKKDLPVTFSSVHNIKGLTMFYGKVTALLGETMCMQIDLEKASTESVVTAIRMAIHDAISISREFAVPIIGVRLPESIRKIFFDNRVLLEEYANQEIAKDPVECLRECIVFFERGKEYAFFHQRVFSPIPALN